MNELVIKLIASIVATGFAGWIIILQTEKKNRVLAILVCLWAVANVVEKIVEISHKDKKPNLIVDQKSIQFDNLSNPTLMRTTIKVQNVGNANAKDVHYNYTAYFREKIFQEGENDMDPTFPPGGKGVIEAVIEGKLLRQAWSGEHKLRDVLIVTYSDEKEKKYTLNAKGLFTREADNKISPYWAISVE